MSELEITIDGRSIRAEKGSTILEMCQKNGIHVPTLCQHPRLRVVGRCRVCVVEVEGESRLTSACTTSVEQEGMMVYTKSQRVLEGRRMVVELIHYRLFTFSTNVPGTESVDDCSSLLIFKNVYFISINYNIVYNMVIILNQNAIIAPFEHML